MVRKERRSCDVCVLVDDDHSEKDVGYCSICKAWMCERCRRSPVRRTQAAWTRGVLRRQ